MSNKDSVDNTALREAVERRIREGETFSSICRKLGGSYMRSDRPRADTTALKRRIGMTPVTSGRRRGRVYSSKTRMIRYDVAVAICEAIDCDPVEMGL